MFSLDFLYTLLICLPTVNGLRVFIGCGATRLRSQFCFPYTFFLRQEFHLVWGQRCIVPGSPFLSVILHILLFSVSRVLYVYDFFLNVEVSTLLYIFFSQLICILYLFFLSLSTLRSKTHVEIHEWVLYTFVTFFFLFQHYFCLL